MSERILITGSSGLIGRALTAALRLQATAVIEFDIRAQGNAQGDVRSFARLRDAVEGVTGIVHLAAISRVIWGEQNPALCWETNVGGLQNLLQAIAGSPLAPWLIFASSREVYGQPSQFPANEDTPLRPVNVYGRAKAEGEKLISDARKAGHRACTIRLSNVFGTSSDHADRVVPAFAQAAAHGQELRVDGSEHTFDFTHIEDVTRGITALIDVARASPTLPPPIHFVSGKPTTLGELAALAIQLARSASTIRQAPPRSFDVARFWGDPTRAHTLLDWQPQVSLEQGLSGLINAFRETREPGRSQEPAQ